MRINASIRGILSLGEAPSLGTIKKILFAALLATALVFTQGAAFADTTVYAVTAGQSFGTLDLTTGVFTPIPGPALNTYGLGEYAGALYGASTQCVCLYQINPSSGAATFSTNSFSQNGNNFGAMNGFGSTTNGLYAIGAAFGGLNSLYSVNPATGTVTTIGSTGVTAGGGTGYLSSSTDSSLLYWEVQTNTNDALYSINTTTGVATLIGTVTTTASPKTGNPYAIVYTGGTLWANFYASGFGTISTSTGAQTYVSTNANPAYAGLAPYPLASTSNTLIGSMPHLAALGGWNTSFTFVNKGTGAASMTNSLYAPNGTQLALPIVFPQTGTNTTAPSVTQTVAPNASFIMQATGTASVPYLEGSAQLSSNGNMDGFAIFHFDPNQQEAVVPMETRAAPSYIIAFDNTNGVLTGIALANVSNGSSSIPVIIRDDKGNPIFSTFISLPANGHTSFVLSDPNAGYAVTANIRGTIEFDAPSGSLISVLGIRYTGGTITTLPSIANVGTGGGLMAHLASAFGWQTTFVLVNTGGSTASATLNFYDNGGNPLNLPLTSPQGTFAGTTAPTITQNIASHASLWVQSAGPIGGALLTGSAQLTTTGNVGGFVIFRYNPNGQEAVVPLETRNANAYIIPFDNTNGTVTGIALSAATPLATVVPVVIRDDQGNAIGGAGNIAISINGHTSFVLSQQFSITNNIRGTIEFDKPAGTQISVIGIRTPPALTFTTLPPLAR